MSDLLTRRDLFRVGGLMAIGLTAPKWLATAAQAELIRASQGNPNPKDTVLVVLQLSGGNDGLNTIVPYADPQYYKLRPTVSIAADKVLKINEQIGFHPSLGGLAEMYQKGKVAIIQNVGYPQPNRSHFKSMEIWQSGGPETPKYGWVGRHLDKKASGSPLNPVYAIGLSSERPRALDASVASVPCFASLADIQNMIGDPDTEKMLRSIQGADAAAGTSQRVVQQANRAAFDAMAELSSRLKTYTPTGQYGNDAFGQGFRQVAHLVAASPMTRLIYFSAGGFDTHARQLDQHANLLKQFSDAVSTFQAEIEKLGKAEKVVVLVFSEFGRRSYENASSGTDHGAAAPMFLVGQNVKGGLYGPMPNLMDLTDGDLKHAIDFRQVYATAIDQWMGGDAEGVLGARFEKLSVLK